MASSGRTLVCSVLFLDIVEYSKKPVSEQLSLKQEFNRELTKSLEQVPPRDRIILDTGDGAAVTFMGDPEDALFAAMAMRDSAGALAVRLGVNLGPVRLVKDLNSQLNIIGDGINVAQRVMSFARPGASVVRRGCRVRRPACGGSPSCRPRCPSPLPAWPLWRPAAPPPLCRPPLPPVHPQDAWRQHQLRDDAHKLTEMIVAPLS